MHAGFGTTTIGVVSLAQSEETRESRHVLAVETEYPFIMQQIINAPALVTTAVSPSDLLAARLEKLIVNAMINPLTVIFNRRNGCLFNHPEIASLMQRLLAETCLIIRSLPSFQSLPGAGVRFSLESLEHTVRVVASKTANNISSMLSDVRAGRETEIDYINGYIISEGNRLRLSCTYNRRIVQLVKDKQLITEAQIQDFFPDCL